MKTPASGKRPFEFAEIKDSGAPVPVPRVTPVDGSYVHTYYDVCPWSPSGSNLAATKLPCDDRYPRLGDSAEVCVIDLRDRTIQTVHRTQSSGYQAGANLNWGATDRYLYTNDIEWTASRPVCESTQNDRRALGCALSAVRRLDGHPNWDREFRKIIFQAAPEGKRQLYVAAVREMISA
ncbi:MAG: hypothetical protein IT161_08655 [Bryobacterales bacterium]|nr:hypothetical protein [Bryobacterales bacterium]